VKDVGERRDLKFRHPEVLQDRQQRLAEREAEMAQASPALVVN
jgi:hypothetical protein